MRKFKLCVVIVFLFLASCREKEKQQEKDQGNVRDHSNYEVASNRYSDLNNEALNRMSSLDFDSWGELLADDVQYFFPDGDAETRTVLKGKQEVLDWWKNWKETTGIDSMRFNDRVHIPVQANQKLNYSGLTGVIVISYFSNEMIYNGQPARVRTNVAVHYNEDSLIDRFYTYYDRTPILKVVNANALEIVADKGK